MLQNKYLIHDPFPKQNNISNNNDRIYYNVIIPYNPINGVSNAIYLEELNQAIVQNPSEYYLSIIRFTIPTQYIPILIPDIQPYPNTDVNLTTYSVTLTYSTFTSGQIFIEFVSANPYIIPMPISINNKNADRSGYYYIFSYNSFLLMINTALSNAFTALSTASGGTLPAGSAVPYFQFDPINSRISLVATIAGFDNSLMTPINIYVNTALFTFLDGINNIDYGPNALNGKNNHLLVVNYGNNSYNPPGVSGTLLYYIITQEYQALPDWNSFKSLILASNSLPIKPEYLPRRTNFNQGVINTRGILKDFEPLIDLGPEARTVVQYQLNSPYQLINLNSNTPLTKIDISIYWLDEYGNQYLVQIPPNEVATIKMVFIKKSTFEGY